MQGLYIHIPFCIKKCNYCDFISFACEESKMQSYVIALKNEIECIVNTAEDKTIDTVFIGGGTPSYLDSSLIVDIMDTARKCFNIKEDAEITLEANPKTFTKQKLIDYKKAGINRLSIGLQSANEESLKILGRVHSYDDFLNSYNMAREQGFENINIDLIYNIPSETKIMFKNTIDKVIKLKPDHISLYSLIIEEGTPFYDMNEKGLLQLASEEDEEEMIAYAKAQFENTQYNRYEISNYAKEGKKCRHNMNYWQNGYYFAAGLGAHACLNIDGNIIRQKNDNTLSSYIKGCFSYKKECILKEDSMFETVMLGLRLVEGLNTKSFQKRYEISFFDAYADTIKKLFEEHLLEQNGDYVRLNEHGLNIQNTVLLQFMN